PSSGFPVPSQRQVKDSGGVIVDGEQGCWTSYSEARGESDLDAFAFYMDPSNTTGWTLEYYYPQTRYAAFHKDGNPRLRVTVGVWGGDIGVSICRCDPQRMQG